MTVPKGKTRWRCPNCNRVEQWGPRRQPPRCNGQGAHQTVITVWEEEAAVSPGPRQFT